MVPVPAALVLHRLLDGPGNKRGLPLLVSPPVEGDLLPLGVLGPKGFALALEVVGDDPIGRVQDAGGAAVVFFQADDPGGRELLLKGEDVFDGGSPGRRETAGTALL